MNKKIFASIIAFCLVCFASAQVVIPYGMPYQALVKNADNTIVAEQNVGVHVALMQAGKVIFEETQTVATDANGVLSMVIGDNQLQTIDWSLGGYTLKVEIDPEGGTSYALVTEQGMVSVPYAFYTQNAADAFSRDYKDLKNAPEIPVVPTKISAFENDANYLSKEAQQLKLDGATISISDGVEGVVNSVDLPQGEFDYYNVEGRPLANAQGDMLYWDAQAKAWKPITGGENMILTIGLDGTLQWIDKDHAAEPEITELTVVAGKATDITRTKATVSAEVFMGMDVIERGFLYSLYPGRVLESNANYELIGTVKDGGVGTGTFSYEFTDLIQGAIYYVRAYAKTSEKTVYSDDIKVVMQDPEGLVDCGKMVDADGNEYRTVVLGNTCWIRENLHTTKYADGTPIKEFIPLTTTSALPKDETQYSRFAVLNTPDTMPMEVSGLYYGLGFINDEKAICPTGWHVSTFEDWADMLNYVSETYANNTSVNMSPTSKGAIASTAALSNPLVIPYYFGSYAFGKKAENSNATGFGWFYAGSMNGNTTRSYQRCEGRYDAYWTSTKNGSNCLPWFIQNSGSALQRYYESGCQLYGYLVRCVKDVPKCGELTVTYNDYDYNTVQVGEQCWLKENLQTTKYADGTKIEYGGSSASEMDGYYYYPNRSEANQNQYGLLYNWAALMYHAKNSESNPSGVRSLCPDGWHIPSMAEFQQLKDAINTPEYQCEGDNSTVKAICSNTGWTKSDVKCLPGYEQETANNATGFSAMPAGKFSNERYLQFSQGASFWTSSYWDIPKLPIQTHIFQGINFLYVGQDDNANRTDAMSVRCLRD